ncbi:MAG: dTDP-4-dehydrorhamnose reductase [Pseudomonadales bacterium]|nr:dTDP-4-dehydrorhamnose reductase [Pseudomonadales bacterium]
MTHTQKPMKILLTGSNGQLGLAIRNQVFDYDLALLAVDHQTLDITNLTAIRALLRKENINLIVNAAAYTDVDQAESNQQLAYDTNALGAHHLAIVAKEHNLPLFHISTDYVFNGQSTTTYDETAQPNPVNTYGHTKLQGENFITTTASQYLILRTSWVFSITGKNFVKTMLKLSTKDTPLKVIADQFGNPTYAGHLATALLKLAQQYQRTGTLPWGTYNFCDSGITTWHAFASAIMTLAADNNLIDRTPVVQPITTEEYPVVAKRPMYSALNCTKFNQAFPDIDIMPWQTGLAEMLSQLAIKRD